MRIRAFVAFCGLAVLAAAACGQKAGSDSDPNDESGGTNPSGGSGQGGTAGAAASGGGGLAGSGAGPAITSAPPAWIRPADCGGIGERCPDLSGCGPLSVCQLEGNVCIPRLPDGATMLPSRTPETPYCAAYTCMTFDQASCFCTGEAATVTPSCSSPGALAGICTGLDGSCASRACCDGLSCVDTGGGRACKQACATATDCASGCCTDRYDTGILSCAELDACTNPCKRRGEACMPGSSTTPNDCCRGTCIESLNPDYAGCRPTCTTSEQCDTGCCVPFSDSTSGFCASAEFCSCGAEAAACGPNSPACCEGTTCAGQSAVTLTCRRLCSTAADCPGTLCLPLSDNSASICDATCAMVGTACGPENPNCCAGATCAGVEGEASYSCYLACDEPTDCPGGYCELIDGMNGICIE